MSVVGGPNRGWTVPPRLHERYPKQSVLRFRRDPLGFVSELAQLGDVVRFRLVSPSDVYLVNDPDLVRRILATDDGTFLKASTMRESKRLLGEGLLTSEGDLHRSQRRLLNPVFTHARVLGYADEMLALIRETSDSWRDGTTIDVHHHMIRLTLRIASRTLVSRDLGDQTAELNDSLTRALKMLARLTLPYSNVWEHLPLPSLRQLRADLRYLNETMTELISGREGASETYDDLLALLLKARGERPEVTDDLVRAELATIFFAALESSSSALSWTWFLLAENPDVEARLHAELADVLGGRPPTPDDLDRLPITSAVVHESMRMYPPVWILGRRVVSDFDYDGLRVRAGSSIVMSPWVTHHDERWYPEPFRFDLERWTPAERAQRPPHAFYPFGVGPRTCIGATFAGLELRLALATLTQRWRLRLAPGFRPEPLAVLTLRPRYGMSMTVESR